MLNTFICRMNTLDQKTCVPYTTDWINWSQPANDNFLDDQEWILADILSIKGLQSLLDSYINGKPKYLTGRYPSTNSSRDKI